MNRVYIEVIKEHFATLEQMVFLEGARQVGKTTIALKLKESFPVFFYFNWDVLRHKRLIVAGATSIANVVNFEQIRKEKPLIVFDEIHKYGKWKQFLKGFYDLYKGRAHILVTGSSRLSIFKKGSDSLMGRYFYYRIHPLSVKEILSTKHRSSIVLPPQKIEDSAFNNLVEFGGFPEVLTKSSSRFSLRWAKLRMDQLIKEDIRELTLVQSLGELEILAQLIIEHSGNLLNYSNLASKLNVSNHTTKKWIKTLGQFYFCFLIKPWSKNVTRSLVKEPKIYLWDWSLLNDHGKRAENLIASHLLKAIHFWNDNGLGEYDLYFVRDTAKREVDFLVTKNHNPWILLEVKSSNNKPLSPALLHFRKQLNPQYTFQVAMDAEYVDIDCFSQTSPAIVPAKTFLSQLI